MIEDLFRLHLADGLPVEREGRTLRYRTVTLRETTVADERAATRAAERVVSVRGEPKLLVSDADFRFALTARHVVAFEADAANRIGDGLVDAELLERLSSHDLALIEQRIFLITLAAEVRYGNITREQFEAALAGRPKDAPGAPAAPQPVGQAADVGAAAAAPEPGPAMLADYAGDAAAGPAAGHAA